MKRRYFRGEMSKRARRRRARERENAGSVRSYGTRGEEEKEKERELEARVANGGVPGLEGDASGAARLKRRQGGVP